MSPEGFDQAAQIAEELSKEPLSAVYSSPLIRARETAGLIAQHHQLEVKIDPDLVEIDQGDWEGLSETEVRTRWPDRTVDGLFVSRPAGETLGAVLQRALSSVGRIVKAGSGETVAVVSHQTLIRSVMTAASPTKKAPPTALAPGKAVRVHADLTDGEIVLSQFHASSQNR